MGGKCQRKAEEQETGLVSFAMSAKHLHFHCRDRLLGDPELMSPGQGQRHAASDGLSDPCFSVVHFTSTDTFSYFIH